MATKFHSTLTGSDLHINKIDGTTGTELTTASETVYDARWVKKVGGNVTLTPTANGTTTFQITKQDGTTQVFDVDTTNVRVGKGTTSPARALSIQAGDGSSNVVMGLNNTGGTEKGFFGVVGTAGNFVGTASVGDFFIRSAATMLFSASGIGTEQLRIQTDSLVGVVKSNPSSTLHVGGAFAVPIANKTGAYTLSNTDYTVTADATSGAFQITLPTAVTFPGRIYNIKRTNSGANAVTVGTTSAQTVDAAASKSLDTQNAAITVQSNGANWVILSQMGTVS